LFGFNDLTCPYFLTKGKLSQT